MDASSPMESSPRRTVLIVIGAVVTLAIAYLVARNRTPHPNAAQVRDVPRVEGSAIVFSTAFRDRIGLGFEPVARASFKPAVRVVGSVTFNPSYMAAIGTRVRGVVRRTFKYEGDRVEQGEQLAEIESAELGGAQASIAQAEASFHAAEANAKRERELLEKNLTTAREAEVAESELAVRRAELQAARQRTQAFGGGSGFGVYVLRSPIAGHIIDRKLSPGQSVDGAEVGYKVADLAHLWVELSVFDRDLETVHLDDEVEVSPLANLQVKLQGKVAHVGEVIDETTRSADVRVAIDHPPVHLRVGQAVQAVVHSDLAARDALLLEQSAVVYVDGKATVFVAEADTRVRAVPVRLGASDGSRYEVLEGLTPGDRVATSGVFALKSELYR